MITRSRSNLSNNFPTIPTNKNRRRRNARNVPELRDPSTIMANPNNQNPPMGMNNNEQPPRPNLRSMEEMLQSPFDGVRRAIVLPEIQARFEIHHGLLNLLSNHSFHGFDNEDPREHLRNFSDIVETYQVNNVPNEVIKLKLFQF